MAVEKTLAYSDTATITSVESYLVQAFGAAHWQFQTRGLYYKTYYGLN
jgi:hypothetical protein